jgi:hypothetical protein
LTSNTKTRKRKLASSLKFFPNLIIIIIIVVVIIAFSIAVPSPWVFYRERRKRRIDDRLGDLKAHRRDYFALALLQMRKPLAHLLVRPTDKRVIRAAHGNESIEALDKNVRLLALMSGCSRRLRSSRRCMLTGRRSMSMGRRRILGCSKGTRINGGGWRRRRNCRIPYNVRLISSMLAIINELHIGLVVNDPLNASSIDHILCPMSEHVPHLGLEKDSNARMSLIINNSKKIPC